MASTVPSSFSTVNGRSGQNEKEQVFNSHQVPSEPKKQEATAITANVANKASTFEWQKYSWYKKNLRIPVYLLLSLPKFACNKTETGSFTDPVNYLPSLNSKTNGFHHPIETPKPAIFLDCGTS